MLSWLKKPSQKAKKLSKEKRISPRLYTLVDVVYTFHNKTGPRVVSQAKDLSMTGMRLLHHKKTTMDTLLDLKIDLPKNEGLVSALGKVVWYKRRKGIGIKFLLVRPADENRHYEFIQKNLAINPVRRNPDLVGLFPG